MGLYFRIFRFWPRRGQNFEMPKMGTIVYINPQNHLRSTIQLSITNIWTYLSVMTHMELWMHLNALNDQAMVIQLRSSNVCRTHTSHMKQDHRLPIGHIWCPCSFWAQQRAFSMMAPPRGQSLTTPWSKIWNAEIRAHNLCQPTKLPQIHYTA